MVFYWFEIFFRKGLATLFCIVFIILENTIAHPKILPSKNHDFTISVNIKSSSISSQYLFYSWVYSTKDVSMSRSSKKWPFILAGLWILFIAVQKIFKAAVAVAIKDNPQSTRSLFGAVSGLSSFLLFVLAAANDFALIRLTAPATQEKTDCACTCGDSESGCCC